MTKGDGGAASGGARADLDEAVALMRRALVLLERSDPGFGAARLQHAIDTVAGAPRAGAEGEWVETGSTP